VIGVAFLWAGWCVLHSLLITARANAWVRRRGGAVAGASRLVYNLVAVVTLFPVLWYQFSLPARPLFAFGGAWRILQGFLLGYAVVMFVAGQRSYRMGIFLGTRQWRDFREGRPPADPPFRTTGALRWVRHPWYSGALALLWVFGPVTDVNLAARLVLGAYLVVGTLLEERKLLAEIGEPYAAYRRRVPMLVPWKIPRD